MHGSSSQYGQGSSVSHMVIQVILLVERGVVPRGRESDPEDNKEQQEVH